MADIPVRRVTDVTHDVAENHVPGPTLTRPRRIDQKHTLKKDQRNTKVLDKETATPKPNGVDEPVTIVLTPEKVNDVVSATPEKIDHDVSATPEKINDVASTDESHCTKALSETTGNGDEADTIESVQPPKKKARTKKRRRKNPNINKQIAMKMNRGIIAWRLAATESRYFTGGLFSKLPKRGTEEYAVIKTRQQSILAFWVDQAAEHKYALTALREAAQEQCLLYDEASIVSKQEGLNEVQKPEDVSEEDWAIQREENSNTFAKELDAAKRCFQCFLPIIKYPKYDQLRARQKELIKEYAQIDTENDEWDARQTRQGSTTNDGGDTPPSALVDDERTQTTPETTTAVPMEVDT